MMKQKVSNLKFSDEDFLSNFLVLYGFNLTQQRVFSNQEVAELQSVLLASLSRYLANFVQRTCVKILSYRNAWLLSGFRSDLKRQIAELLNMLPQDILLKKEYRHFTVVIDDCFEDHHLDLSQAQLLRGRFTIFEKDTSFDSFLQRIESPGYLGVGLKS